MSYVVTLECGCEVYVSRDPRTGLAHTRVVERHSRRCPIRTHAVGVRLPLWELLPHATSHTAIRLTTAGHRRTQ